jgi:hypothetical protein
VSTYGTPCKFAAAGSTAVINLMRVSSLPKYNTNIKLVIKNYGGCDRSAMIKAVAFGLKIKLFEFNFLRTFTGVVEKDPATALYVGYVPGF